LRSQSQARNLYLSITQRSPWRMHRRSGNCAQVALHEASGMTRPSGGGLRNVSGAEPPAVMDNHSGRTHSGDS